MIFSAVMIVSALSLLSSTSAAAIRASQNNCTFVCPDKDLDGNAFRSSATSDGVISCSHFGESFSFCKYNSTNGTLVGDGHCPQNAVQKCNVRRGLKQAVVRRGAPDQPADPDVEWKHHGSPSPGRKRDVPPPTSSVWPPYSPSPSWSPSPSKPKPGSPPSTTPQPCSFRCPRQDLAMNPLTDEAFRDPDLFCSYSTPHCETCSFCKYSMKTGALIQDNDDGNCPQTASATRPWDRRYA